MTRRKTVVIIAASILLCLVSAFATSGYQTNSGKTKLKSTKIVSASGNLLAVDVFIPSNATPTSPAPTIVMMHGGNNSKEAMNIHFTELQRRGYVVLVPDMYSMGQSERLPDSRWMTAGRGMYDTVKYALTLPFVDKDRIALVGYSRGGACANETILLDNAAPSRVVRAAFIIHSDPTYKDKAGKFTDIYGSRDIGLVADKYDEFFFSEKVFSAVYSNDANRYAAVLSSAADYIKNPSAQSFLNFGSDPAVTTEKRVGETVYQKQFDGKPGTRIINVTDKTHMSGWWSQDILTKELEFFQRVMPPPVALATTDFVFLPNTIFGFMGIVGFFMFLVGVCLFLANETRAFANLKLGEARMADAPDAQGKLWFWGSQAAVIGVGVYVVWLLNKWKMNIYIDTVFRSAQPIYQGLWATAMGVVVLALCVAWYQLYGKKRRHDLKATGLFPGWAIIGKSFVTAVLVVVVAWVALVFSARYFFQTDYHAVLWFLLPFDADRISGMIRVFPLYAIFYVTVSISMNCFNYNAVLGKNRWVNNVLLSFVIALPPLIVIAYTYGAFMASGKNPMFGGLAASATAMIWAPAVLFTAAFTCRKIYEGTNNPWLSGFVSAIFVTIFNWTMCEIRVPEASKPYAVNWHAMGIIMVGVIGVVTAYLYFQKQKAAAAYPEEQKQRIAMTGS